MTPMEGRSLRRGAVLLLALSILRLGVDGVTAPDSGALVEDGSELPNLLDESREAREDQAHRSAPLTPGETVDPNRSEEVELDRLPGIGPSTASAWVASRSEGGGFGRPEDLLRVRGIGPKTLERIRPFLDFSNGMPTQIRVDRKWTSVTGSDPRIDLNRAAPGELESLPGIGPALARRIVESRKEEGPFRAPSDLMRIRGIGPATLERIRGLILPAG